MPEGHVIHRLAHALTDTFGGRPVNVTSPQGRFEAAPLDGAEIERGEAVGKHLFIDFSTGDVVHIHLGLIGKLTLEPLAPPRGQVRPRTDDGVTAADLRGTQWCRTTTPPARAARVTRAGTGPRSTAGQWRPGCTGWAFQWPDSEPTARAISSPPRASYAYSSTEPARNGLCRAISCLGGCRWTLQPPAR